MWQGMSKTGIARKIMACLIVALGASSLMAQGRLSTVRDDVRRTPPTSSSHSKPEDDDHCDGDSIFGEMFGKLLFHGLTSPFWGPAAVAQADFVSTAYFPRFPYQETGGYIVSASWAKRAGDSFRREHRPDPFDGYLWPTEPRRWGARVRFDYGDNFDGLERVGGHLLMSTSSRFGLDTEMNYLRETFPGGEDRLWIGDCNVIYRFAQSERMQWRAGVGFNWLDDPLETNYGFNFTYGADFFPHKPWVLSATLDWGSLGRAELFRFRSTVGVLVFGMEAYTGYEYLDVDNTQINSLIGGVRIWF